MEKISIQKCTLECCGKQLNNYIYKIWIENIKPHVGLYIVGLFIIFASWLFAEIPGAGTALIAVAAPVFAIIIFYAQQRTARIQKIYYEGSFLSVLNISIILLKLLQ